MQFTRKLTYDEQRALSPEEEKEYWKWLFRIGEIVCKRREYRDEHEHVPWWQTESEADERAAIRHNENWWGAPWKIKKQSGAS